MTRITLLSVLLLVVYQFDDLVRAVHRAWTLIRRGQYRRLALDSDHYVGTALLICGLPLSLNYLLVSDRDLGQKLLAVTAVFVAGGLASWLVSVVLPRVMSAPGYRGASAFAAVIHSLVSAAYPHLRMVTWHGGRASRDLAKISMVMSLPPLLGFAFRWYLGDDGYMGGMMGYMDALIVVMVGGMFIHLVVGPVRRYLSSRHVGPFGLLRFVAGLAITTLLLA